MASESDASIQLDGLKGFPMITAAGLELRTTASAGRGVFATIAFNRGMSLVYCIF